MAEIEKICTLSTSHITAKTERMLQQECYSNAMGLTVYQKSEFGFFIFIPEKFWEIAEIPKELKDCMAVAMENECQWLCLDCDALEHDGLAIFDW